MGKIGEALFIFDVMVSFLALDVIKLQIQTNNDKFVINWFSAGATLWFLFVHVSPFSLW